MGKHGVVRAGPYVGDVFGNSVILKVVPSTMMGCGHVRTMRRDVLVTKENRGGRHCVKCAPRSLVVRGQTASDSGVLSDPMAFVNKHWVPGKGATVRSKIRSTAHRYR